VQVVREHPSDVYVPLGDCQRCGSNTFLDGTPDNLRVRPHAIQDREKRAALVAAAARNGRRLYEFPLCPGSGYAPVARSVSLPIVWFDRT